MKLNIGTYSKKSILFFFFLFLLTTSVYGKDELKSLTEYLDYIIINKQQFTRKKEQRINSLKLLLKEKSSSPEYEYEINLKLYDEYKKYILDSAIYYIRRNNKIADSLQNTKYIYASKIQMASLYSYSGKPREAESILKNLTRKDIPQELLPIYYDTYAKFFEHYRLTSGQNTYADSKKYRDSLVAILDTTSFEYIKNKASDYRNSNKLDEAEGLYKTLMSTVESDSPEYASLTYDMGVLYTLRKDHKLEKEYFTLSAIADVRSSIRENASFIRLAYIYNESGDIERAFKYTQSAIEDAVSSGVQFRTTQMAHFYSIINAAYQEQLADSKAKLQIYIVLISILLAFLILLVIYIYKQMKKISKIKEELSMSNKKLTQLNNDLNQSNEYLFESNQIKERYIVHFLDLCSDYIDKMEDYRKSLNRLALNNQIDVLLKKLRSTTLIDNEIEELYKNFDAVFLSLYPTFVSDFNALLATDEQITLKSEDLLNRELRIYALLRLGISDSTKIASFLRCSVSTVYNYRTKIRNKAVVPRDEFEDVVIKIGLIHN